MSMDGEKCSGSDCQTNVTKVCLSASVVGKGEGFKRDQMECKGDAERGEREGRIVTRVAVSGGKEEEQQQQ